MISAEEQAFLKTLDRGMKHFDEAGAQAQTESTRTGGKPLIPADVAFLLSDTYGFPLDLTAMICRERSWEVDLQGANALMAQQRSRGKASSGKATAHSGTQGFSLSYRRWSSPPTDRLPLFCFCFCFVFVFFSRVRLGKGQDLPYLRSRGSGRHCRKHPRNFAMEQHPQP